MAAPRRTPDPDLPAELRAVLDLERAWAVAPTPGMTKERAARERFGITPTRYRLLLHRAIDDPRALAYDPLLVRRLLRLRDRRRGRLRGA
ncbi:MAG: DUF3263 domain-containing protein [Actinomycetota bacterium]